MKVIWSKNAQKKYYKTVEHLADNFSYNTAVALEDEVNKLLVLVKSNVRLLQPLRAKSKPTSTRSIEYNDS